MSLQIRLNNVLVLFQRSTSEATQQIIQFTVSHLVQLQGGLVYLANLIVHSAAISSCLVLSVKYKRAMLSTSGLSAQTKHHNVRLSRRNEAMTVQTLDRRINFIIFQVIKKVVQKMILVMLGHTWIRICEDGFDGQQHL